MKIALFTQNIVKGGLDTFIVNLTTNWPDDDRLILFCNQSHPGLRDLEKKLGNQIQVVSYDFWLSQDLMSRTRMCPRFIQIIFRALFWFLGFPYLVIQTYRLFRRFRPERLMIINGSYPGGDACLAAAIAWLGINLRNKSWHNFHSTTLPYPANFFAKIKSKVIDLLVVKASAGLVTVSSACLSTINFRPYLKKLPASYIYNGLNPNKVTNGIPLRDELGLPSSSKLILMLASYNPIKGHALIISAMGKVLQRNPNTHLLICGDGDVQEINEVKRICNSFNISQNVILKHHRDDVGNLLTQCDVLVMPSIVYESFGYSVAEAMALGCPAVVTNVGGLPEVVENGKTGFVVEATDPSLIADKIILLLNDSNLRTQMISAGKVRYESLFKAKNMAKQYYQLIHAE